MRHSCSKSFIHFNGILQVDLLISFCLSMGFSSVVFVGHDDGGLLALKTAEKLRVSTEPVLVSN